MKFKLRRYASADAPIITRRMRAHIATQAAYQLAAMAALVGFGDVFFGVASGRGEMGAGLPPSEHYTIVFNTFVLMQLVNQVNCRKVNNKLNVLEGIGANPLFLGIFAMEAVLQVAIVQYGGVVFNTHPLTAGQWGACAAIAAAALPLRAVGSHAYCEPRHRTHFESSFLESNGIL